MDKTYSFSDIAVSYGALSWKPEVETTIKEDLRRCMRSFAMAYTGMGAEWQTGRNAFFDTILSPRAAGVLDPVEVGLRKPAPEPFELQFRQERADRAGTLRCGLESRYMAQESLNFPPATLKESFLYRVEHSTNPSLADKRLGRGPYGGDLDDVPYTKIVDGKDTTPPPCDDHKLLEGLRTHLGIGYVRSAHHFGFEAPEKMVRWFDSKKFWASVPRAGYVVRRYWGIVIHGECQSVLDTRYPFRRVDTLTVL